MHYIYVYIYIYIFTHTHTHIQMPWLIYASVDGHLGCFHVLAIINSAAMNIGVPAYLLHRCDRNLYAGQEATVRTGHGTTDWFQIVSYLEYVKAVYCHSAYLTYMQSTSRQMLGWKKHKLESRLLGEIAITSDMQMTPHLWQKVKKS